MSWDPAVCSCSVTSNPLLSIRLCHFWTRPHFFVNRHESNMLNIYYSPAHYLFLLPFTSSTASTPESQLQQSLGSLAVAFCWCSHYCWYYALIIRPFYFQGSGVPIYCYDTWCGCMCRVHISLLELQAIALMLGEVVFQLSSNVVALHFDNSTVIVYLCISRWHSISFSFHTSLAYFESGW